MQVLRSEEKAGRAGLSKCQKKKKRGLYPHLSRARLLAPRNTGERQPLRTRSSFSPSPLLPSHPAPRTGGGEAREPGGAGHSPEVSEMTTG